MKNLFAFLLIFLSLTQISLAQVEDNPGTGLIFNDQQYEQDLMKAPLTRSLYGTSLPSSASLKQWAPTPKSQGQYGTCVGWATAFCAYTIIEAKKNGWTDKATIDANTLPGFIYKQIKMPSDNSCKLGSSISDALELIKTKGVAKYRNLDINCPTSIPFNLFNEASKYKIQDYAKLFDLYDSENFKVEAVKKSLSQGKPVVIGMKVPKSFDTAKNYWLPTENPSGNYGGHAMCVIGYDDNKYGGAFEIQNSWGTWWGNNGYIWVRYNDFKQWVKYAYELIEIPQKTANNYIQLAGSVKLIQSNGNQMTASFVNGYYRTKNAYKSGTKFRIYISNNEPAFVYAFGSDATLQVFPVFPHKPNISPALNYKQNDVAIPDEQHYIEMDNTVGKDYLVILYSIEPIDIKQVYRDIEHTSGDFISRVKTVLADKLVRANEVRFNTNVISFKAKTKDKSAVAMIIETKHIK